MFSKVLSSFIMVALMSFGATAAFAGGNLTIVASDSQIADMGQLFVDLEENDVIIKKVAPKDFASVKEDTYMLVVTSQGDPTETLLRDKLTDPVKKLMQTKGGKKFVLLRDAWQNGQEIIVFAGNTEADAAAVRKASKDSWWEIMGSWYDIMTDGMHGY